MKNVTLSADEKLIELARAEARARKTTLNQLFRDWLAGISRQHDRQQSLEALLGRLDYVKAGKKLTRDEMNER